jgi:hypothetical protein
MTIADWIRSMDDIELAQFLYAIMSEYDKVMSDKLSAQGVPHSLIDMPVLSVAHHLQFLRSPREDYFEFEEN